MINWLHHHDHCHLATTLQINRGVALTQLQYQRMWIQADEFHMPKLAKFQQFYHGEGFTCLHQRALKITWNAVKLCHSLTSYGCEMIWAVPSVYHFVTNVLFTTVDVLQELALVVELWAFLPAVTFIGKMKHHKMCMVIWVSCTYDVIRVRNYMPYSVATGLLPGV